MFKHNSIEAYRILFPDGRAYTFYEDEIIKILLRSKLEYNGVEREFSVEYVQGDIFIQFNGTYNLCAKNEYSSDNEDEDYSIIQDTIHVTYGIPKDLYVQEPMAVYYIPGTDNRVRILLNIDC